MDFKALRPMPLNEQLGIVEGILKRLGIRYVIAGGYPRDIAYGIKPKDADVWLFCPTEYVDKLEEALLSADRPTVHFPYLGEYGDETNSNDGRIAYLLKSGDVDLLFMQDVGLSEKELVDTFDYNLNQFVIHGGHPVFLGDARPELGLVRVRDDVRDSRVEKVKQKYAKIFHN